MDNKKTRTYTNHIMNPITLLQDIADGMKKLEKEARTVDVNYLNVQFFTGKKRKKCVMRGCSVSQAIDWIINDVYYDENSDWSEATSATVEIL